MTARSWHAGSCVLCLVLTCFYAWRLDDGSEFAGGRITGPILQAFECGSLLFLGAFIAALLSFRRSSFRWSAVALTLLASLLCLPLYLFILLPGLAQRVLPGPFSVPAMHLISWDPLSIAGVVALFVACYLAWRRLRVAN
jgi:hypothetical protein